MGNNIWAQFWSRKRFSGKNSTPFQPTKMTKRKIAVMHNNTQKDRCQGWCFQCILILIFVKGLFNYFRNKTAQQWPLTLLFSIKFPFVLCHRTLYWHIKAAFSRAEHLLLNEWKLWAIGSISICDGMNENESKLITNCFIFISNL